MSHNIYKVFPNTGLSVAILGMNTTLELDNFIPPEGKRWVVISLKDDKLVITPSAVKQERLGLHNIPCPAVGSQQYLAAVHLVTDQTEIFSEGVFDLRSLNDDEQHTYPIARLNLIAETNSQLAENMYIRSREAILKSIARDSVLCPICHGHKRLAAFTSRAHSKPYDVFDCGTCNGMGTVTLPTFGVVCLHGGWGLCPYCFEGQCDNDKPCDVCEHWLLTLKNSTHKEEFAPRPS